MHPHRGIETVTYMLAGAVTHRDSLGNAGTIGAGDVQWMTAGRGIMHEEMPEPVDGRMAGFQLWVNLPARLKMTKPRDQEILSAALPEVRRADGAVVRVIAGSVGDVRGPVTDIFAEPEYLDVTLPADASFEQPVTRGTTRLPMSSRAGERSETAQRRSAALNWSCWVMATSRVPKRAQMGSGSCSSQARRSANRSHATARS